MVKLDYERLKAIRLEQDITQKELAQSTGVSLSTIKQIETGRSSTDLENIQKLCTYLDVDINEIYHPDYHDTKVLCMLNNKGGCGKTSLCSGIATSMAELGLRILVIDGDGQRNLSSSFDMPRSEKNFGAAVLAALDGSTPVLAAVKPKDTDFLRRVRQHPHGEVFNITPESREALYQRLRSRILQWNKEKL